MFGGIDLGGTQVRIALASDDGKLLGSRRARTPELGGARGLPAWISAALEHLPAEEPIRAAAIGAPGPVDTARGVLVNPPNLKGWRNVPLAGLLEPVIHAPVFVENDANLAAVGEFHHGAGRGSHTMVYVTWSTGVGGGLILNGRLFSGAHGAAGEVGHMIIDPDGPLDGCGQRGCLEAFAGGRMLKSRTGRSAADTFAAAENGDYQAREEVTHMAQHVGYGLINLTNVLDPEVIVIGGGISRSWSLIQPILLSTLRSSPFIRPSRRPRLRRARLGDRAGQVGAVEWARLKLQEIG